MENSDEFVLNTERKKILIHISSYQLKTEYNTINILFCYNLYCSFTTLFNPSHPFYQYSLLFIGTVHKSYVKF